MKIAFGYKMRTGKDTSVDYLISKYGGEKITFAKSLYDSLYSTQKIFDLPLQKDRNYLHIVGDWARNKDKDIFVNLALNRVVDNSKNYFCNDLRFMNEFKNLKSRGWICVKINRNSVETGNHISEIELNQIPVEDWDFVIDNNFTIEDLYSTLDSIVQKISK
jgi:hypothetical protein